MSDTRPPAFQHYPKDYLADPNTMVMTLEQEGAYRRLMDYMWLEGGSLKNEPAELARLCKVSKPHFLKRIWPAIEPCFRVTRAGNLRHSRLDRERKKQVARRTAQSEGGKRSALKRSRSKSADSSEPAGTLGDPKHLGSTLEVRARAQSPVSSLRSPSPFNTSRPVYGQGTNGKVKSEKEQRPKHPQLGATWRLVKPLLDDVYWRGGDEVVELSDGYRVELGLEYWLLNDLLHGDVEPTMLVWIIENAAHVFGWDGTERHTLYWLEGENLAVGESAFHKSRPASTIATELLQLPAMPAATQLDRTLELREQVRRLRERDHGDAEEPDDELRR
jgi:uncharacterized protein YdaU (DUF1376 family)